MRDLHLEGVGYVLVGILCLVVGFILGGRHVKDENWKASYEIAKKRADLANEGMTVYRAAFDDCKAELSGE